MNNTPIPGAVCPQATCPLNQTCIRHKNYLKALANEPSFTVLNTRLFTPSAECPHYLITKTVRIAYGFKKLYGTLPTLTARLFWTETPFKSESAYYRYKRGEYGLSLEMQQKLLSIFKKNGANTVVGFDRYQDEIIYVKPH